MAFILIFPSQNERVEVACSFLVRFVYHSFTREILRIIHALPVHVIFLNHVSDLLVNLLIFPFLGTFMEECCCWAVLLNSINRIVHLVEDANSVDCMQLGEAFEQELFGVPSEKAEFIHCVPVCQPDFWLVAIL